MKTHINTQTHIDTTDTHRHIQTNTDKLRQRDRQTDILSHTMTHTEKLRQTNSDTRTYTDT